MFDSELLIASVANDSKKVEIIWDDDRENWVRILAEEMDAHPISEAGEVF